MWYEVIVGNVGLVERTSLFDCARQTFENYVDISLSGYGRASGESVTLLVYRSGESGIFAEYCPAEDGE